jgi:sec-independent protein translocase protein TatC
MADELEVLPPESEDEEAGGPVKSFLDHLEDLRWTLIKCAAAFAIGFVVCLSAAPWIISFLKWPLDRALAIRTIKDPRTVLLLGSNVLAKLPTQEVAREAAIPGLATNADTFFRLVPQQIGTNWVMGMVRETNPPVTATFYNSVALKNFGPISGFNIIMDIAIYGGVVVAAPFILFFLGQFILPALHIHERNFVFKISGFAGGLFFLGVAFCYFLMLIICLSTTVTFSQWLGFGADEWQAEQYISFVTFFMLGMGLAFELPLVLLTLVKIGILNATKLNQFRMYWVVAGMVLAGFITPDGNPINMILLFLPLHVLYEISVIIAWWWERQERRAMAARGES